MTRKSASSPPRRTALPPLAGPSRIYVRAISTWRAFSHPSPRRHQSRHADPRTDSRRTEPPEVQNFNKEPPSRCIASKAANRNIGLPKIFCICCIVVFFRLLNLQKIRKCDKSYSTGPCDHCTICRSLVSFCQPSFVVTRRHKCSFLLRRVCCCCFN